MSDVKTKSQKIIRVGNSYAVTIDKAYIDKYGMKVSDAMSITYYTASPLIKMSPEKSGSVGDLTGLDDITRKEMKTVLHEILRQPDTIEEMKDLINKLDRDAVKAPSTTPIALP